MPAKFWAHLPALKRQANIQRCSGKRMVVSRGWGGEEEGEFLSDGNRVSVEDYGQALELEGGDGGTTVRTCLMPLNCIPTDD